MKIGLIHNPRAGHGDSSTDDIETLLKRHGYDPVSLPRDSAVADAARAAGAAFVAVAGGDGTVREAALALVGSGVPLAPVPMGTANNIGESLGIVGSPEKVIGGWSATQPRTMDVGRVRGPWGERYFLEGCGVGLVARGIALMTEIDASTTRRFADPQDKLHRDLSVFVALVTELSPQRVQVSLDGRPSCEDYLLIEVLNIQQAGPRIQLAKRADPSDGFLDVVLATVRDREKLRYSLKSCLAGSTPDPVLQTVKARRVTLAVPGDEFRVDDEVIPLRRGSDALPATVEIDLSILPGALQIIAARADETSA